MEHMAIFTRIKGFQNLITTTVSKKSKSYNITPRNAIYSTKEIKCKTGARLELASLRLLACLLTKLKLYGKLSIYVQIKTMNKKLFSMFILKGNASHNGCIPFSFRRFTHVKSPSADEF